GDSEGAGVRNQRRLEECFRSNGPWVPRGPGAARERASQSAAPRREPAVFKTFDSVVGVLFGAGASGRKTSGKNPAQLPVDFRRIPGPAFLGIYGGGSKPKEAATARRSSGNCEPPCPLFYRN